MGKWIAIIWTAVISIFLYLIVYSSSKGISDDMQEMLDEEQTEIVASMMEEREKKKKTMIMVAQLNTSVQL